MNRPFWSLRSASSENVCDSIEPLLSVYADGMAPPAEARRIEAHLPECEGCRAALSWMQATRTTLASRPVAVPPPDLHSRIALAIAASSAAPVALRPARVFMVRTVYAAAASVTVLGAVLSYGLLHTPTEVSVKPPVRPIVAATGPLRGVKPQFTPKTSPRPLVASNTVKPLAVKHMVIAHKTAPMAVIPLEHTASNAVPTKLPVVPEIIVKAPVHHALPKIASREIAPTEKHSIEKHSPLPKTPAPKLPDAAKIAKVIHEPSATPLDIRAPKITSDSIVQTASAHQAPSSASSDPLGSYKAQLKENESKFRSISFASVSVPVGRTAQSATNLMHTLSRDNDTAFIPGVYTPTK